MKVTLVQPPTNRFDTSELAPPLSLLTVASVLEDDDFDVTILDMNVLGVRDPGFVDADFYRKGTELIAATHPDVVGFTSMALESHICLELGRRVKGVDPSVRIVLGGPHFSAIAREVLRYYPWVDYVITGEGELPTRSLLRRLRGGSNAVDFSNVAHRKRGEFALDRQFKPYSDLNELPFPAYHLVDLEEYFSLNPYRVLDIEHARGCALKCAFCYSSVHWGQGEQAKRIDRIVEDVHRHYELGARHLFFVADNFVNSKPFAKALSDAIAEAKLDLTWRCYATLAQLTDELLDSMAESACKYIFVGVDAVSQTTKKQFLKTYFKGWPSLQTTMRRCLDRGITPTCAFMLNPPDADIADTEAALSAAVHTYNYACGVRLNPLTVYSGTGLEVDAEVQRREYSDAKAKMLLDGHWVTQVNDYARERPWLFPFHCTVGAPETYDHFIAATHMCFTLLDNFPRTLMQWIHAGEGPLWPLVSEGARRADYRSLDKRVWCVSEVEAFAEVVLEQMMPPSVRDTLTFELAEHRLRRPARERSVRLTVDSTPLDFRLEAHALVGLSRPPSDYESTDPLPETPSSDRTYLLVPRGPAIRYLEPNAASERLLARLRQAATTGTAISVPAEGVTALMAADVLKLAQSRPSAG